MKTRKTLSVFSVLIIVILCVSLFTACQRFERIETSQVERIVLWTQTTVDEYELNAEESAKFIELFNSSKYAGKGTGEGGTPEFGIRVYFRDGAYLRVNDFAALGKDLEVSLHDSEGKEKAWYYISNEELYTFVSELSEPQNNNLSQSTTNLEFWIAENVDDVDFSKYQMSFLVAKFQLIGG